MQAVDSHDLAADIADRSAPISGPTAHASRKLKDVVIDALRVRHCSPRTERAYLGWIRRFISWSGDKHPRTMSQVDVEAFLSDLARKGEVAESTQRQATSALLFLYRHALGVDLPWLTDVVRAKPSQRLPVVLSKAEIQALLPHLRGERGLILKLMYGTGMRLSEAITLRVKDIDIPRTQIIVRQGKGAKDRALPLPASLIPQLQWILDRRRQWHQLDLALGRADVELPYALARKYPAAAQSLDWQFVFATPTYVRCPRTGKVRRHHLHDTGVQKAMHRAVQRAGITKPAGTHAMRHSFATHMLEARHDIRTIQTLLGHADVSTTMVYTHVATIGASGVHSPLDALLPASVSVAQYAPRAGVGHK